MKEKIKKTRFFKKISRTALYSRTRSFFPVKSVGICDDRDDINDDVEVIKIDWPEGFPKPRVGVIQDAGASPRWTKYCRFLKTNSIPFGIYDIRSVGWIEEARQYDVIIGIESCEISYLDEIRRKFYVLEKHLDKKCYLSYSDIILYEDKILESYLAEVYAFPFIKASIYNSEKEALDAADVFQYPVVSKIVPCAGSVGVELVRTSLQCKKIIKKAFSRNGRKIHVNYSSQKNYVYFQEYVPNDGYDIRIIVIGDNVFGYYRKAPPGDFRASGSRASYRSGPAPGWSPALRWWRCSRRSGHGTSRNTPFRCWAWSWEIRSTVSPSVWTVWAKS